MNILNKHANSHLDEITVNLGSSCNLSCEFCNVVSDDRFNYATTPSDILSKSQLIVDVILNSSKPIISIVLMGGELFHDGVSDSVFEGYYQLLSAAQAACDKSHKQLQISLMTNLVFKNIDRLIELAKHYNCEVHGSYDFVGRFKTQSMVELWHKNATRIKKAEVPFFVSIVGHKFNIKQIKQRSLEWERLYNEYGCFVQYYEPIAPNDQFEVTQHEYADFLIWLYDNYPEEKFLKSLIQNYTNNESLCIRSTWIDSSVRKCCDHSTLIRKMIVNKQCVTCTYADRCPVNCPRIMWKGSYCATKALLDHVINKSN